MFHIVRHCFLQDHSTHIRGTVTLEAKLKLISTNSIMVFFKNNIIQNFPKNELKAIPR